jgi:hypothetical protein
MYKKRNSSRQDSPPVLPDKKKPSCLLKGNPAVSDEIRGFPSPPHDGFGFITKARSLIVSVFGPEKQRRLIPAPTAPDYK